VARELTHKHCARCDRTLPVSEFGANRASKDGRHFYCRPCATAQVTESRNRLVDKRRTPDWMTDKHCPACEQTLPLEEFGKDKYTWCGLKYYCKQCESRRLVEWRRARLQRDAEASS
jgi:hypothetical protein